MEYSSNGKATAALTTGIIGSAGAGIALASNWLEQLKNKANNNPNGIDAAVVAALLASSGRCNCNENTLVNRYDLAQEQEIAALKTRNAQLEATIFTDNKMLELYKYVDGKIEGINQRLAEQAVWNATQTGTITCMAGQIAQLMSLTKLVIPGANICPPVTTTTA